MPLFWGLDEVWFNYYTLDLFLSWFQFLDAVGSSGNFFLRCQGVNICSLTYLCFWDSMWLTLILDAENLAHYSLNIVLFCFDGSSQLVFCVSVPYLKEVTASATCSFWDTLCVFIYQGMKFSRNCVQHHVLAFSHSYVQCFATFCRATGLRNLGFPDFYLIKLVGISGATDHAFETWAEWIVWFQPKLIIDIRDNDMAHPSISLDHLLLPQL